MRGRAVITRWAIPVALATALLIGRAMNRWTALAVCALVAALPACGGASTTQQWTDQEVIRTFKDQIQTTLEIDPESSVEEASALIDPSDTAGYYTVWVFKSGYSPMKYEVGDVSVPPHGVLTWGEWEALDPKSLPGEGVRTVLRTYGNVVLSYSVDQEKGGAPRPKLPKGFIRIAVSGLARRCRVIARPDTQNYGLGRPPSRTKVARLSSAEQGAAGLEPATPGFGDRCSAN